MIDIDFEELEIQLKAEALAEEISEDDWEDE